MSLVPWRPFRDLDNWFEDDLPDFWEWPEKLFTTTANSGLMRAPKADLYESDGNIVVEFELPGVDPKDIDLEVKDNMVKIEAKSEEKKEEKKKGYYKKELSRGYYKRVLPLPVEVQDKKAEASYDNGVLKIVIPKVEEKKKESRKVQIKVKKQKTKEKK